MFKNFKKVLKNNRGFTLIELIAVIAILGILMAIAVPRIIGFSDQARRQADRQQAAIVANSVKMLIATGDVTIDQDMADGGAKLSLTTETSGNLGISNDTNFETSGDIQDLLNPFIEVEKGFEYYDGGIEILFDKAGGVISMEGEHNGVADKFQGETTSPAPGGGAGE